MIPRMITARTSLSAANCPPATRARPGITARMPRALDTVLAGHDAFNLNDLSAVMDLMTPDVEWGATGAFPGLERRYDGPEALQQWADDVRAEWSEFEVSLDEVLHEGEDLVVIVERLRGRGRGSGAEVEMRVFAAYWVEDGRIRRRASFMEREEALRAAGLSGAGG